MSETKRITIEGFEDMRGDFGTDIYIIKPVIQCFDDGSNIENAIEEFCIDIYGGEIPENDDWFDRKTIQSCFYRVRKVKQTPSFKYFRAVVDVFMDDDNRVYEIVESEGF